MSPDPSHGDNWFIFHLLSAGDLGSVRKANAHFSEDLLSSLLNEPIPGQGVFWSSVGGKPYPISVRVLSFESLYRLKDPMYAAPAIETYASRLRKVEEELIAEAQTVAQVEELSEGPDADQADAPQETLTLTGESGAPSVDLEGLYRNRAIEAVRKDDKLRQRLDSDGAPWRAVVATIEEALPASLDNRNEKAYQLVQTVLEVVYGARNVGWHSFKKQPRNTTYVKKGARY